MNERCKQALCCEAVQLGCTVCDPTDFPSSKVHSTASLFVNQYQCVQYLALGVRTIITYSQAHPHIGRQCALGSDLSSCTRWCCKACTCHRALAEAPVHKRQTNRTLQVVCDETSAPINTQHPLPKPSSACCPQGNLPHTSRPPGVIPPGLLGPNKPTDRIPGGMRLLQQAWL